MARAIGINHVALEVGDLDGALALYGRLFEFELRGRIRGMAFIDLGDQFIALSERAGGEPDAARHFGLVVDDVEAVRAAVEREGLATMPGFPGSLDFRDPWGNLWQVVAYARVQFERTEGVKRALGISELQKTAEAQAEMAEKGLA